MTAPRFAAICGAAIYYDTEDQTWAVDVTAKVPEARPEPEERR